MAEQTILLDIEVNSEQAVKNIEQAKRSIEMLKAQHAALSEQYAKGEISQDQYYKSLTNVSVETEKQKNILKANTAALKDNVRQLQANNDSLVSMRAQLKKATTAFDNLSKAEREGARGKELQMKISELTRQITAAEEATGRFQRNVGNYKGKFLEAFSAMGGGVSGIINPIKNATGALKVMSQTPIIAILGLIVSVTTKVSEAMGKNQAITERLRVSFSGLSAIGDAVTKVLEKVGNVVAWAAEKIGNLATSLLHLKNSQQERMAVTKEEIALENERNRVNLENAKNENRIAQLRVKANDSARYSAKERKKYLEEIDALEMQNSQREMAYAKRYYEYIKRRNSLTQSSKEEIKEENDALVAYYNAQTAYYNKKASLTRKDASLTSQLNKQTTSDAVDTTKILEGEAKALQEIADAQEKAMTDILKARIDIAEKGSEDELRAREAYMSREAELRKREIENSKASDEQKAELAKLVETKLHNDLLSLREDFASKQRELEMRAANEILSEQQLAIENSINALADGSVEQLKAIVDARKSALEAMRRSESESAEQFRARQIEAQKSYNDSVERLAKAEIEIQSAKYTALAQLSGAISGLLESTIGENKKLASAAKVFALAQIGFSSGEAVAKGIAQAQSVPFPGNLAAMATTITAILSAISSAISTVNGAKFAKGGLVEGAGSGTSDSITARVSNGESVMTAKATSMFYDQLSAMNVAGGGRAFPDAGPQRRAFAKGGVVGASELKASANIDMLRQAMADAVASIQPVVSVREITNVQNKIRTKEMISRK